MFSLSTVEHRREFCVFDVGAFAIKALVCRFEGGKLQILAHASVRQPRRDMPRGALNHLDTLAKTFSVVREKLKKLLAEHDLTVPENVIVSFSSRDFFFDIISFNSIRKTPDLPITSEEMNALARTVEGLSLSRVKSRIASESGLSENSIQPVTSIVNSLSVDRVSVARAIGMKGNNLKTAFLNTFAPRAFVQAFRRALHGAHFRLAGLVPNGVALARVMDGDIRNTEPAIIFDFGASLVTATIVRGQQIAGWTSIPLGYDSLEKMLRKHGDLHALEIMRQMVKGEFCGELQPVYERWCSYVAKALHASLEPLGGIGIMKMYAHGHAHTRLLSVIQQEFFGETAIKIQPLTEVHPLFAEAQLDASWGCAIGAATVGAEILTPLTDPLLKTIRTILYHYE